MTGFLWNEDEPSAPYRHSSWPSALIDSMPSAPAWTVDALCAQVGTEMFFPEKGGTTKPAKRICDECPVREACLEYALENDERHGIWGGLSERERRALIRARKAAAA